MKPKIIIEPDKEDLVTHVADYFLKIVESRNKPVHVSLSGGNTPKLLFKKIVEVYKSRIDWSNVHIWWGDERCVPPDHEDSNYKMTAEYLLDHIEIPDKNIHRIKGEADPVAEAGRYADLINKLIPKYEGVPEYDLIYLGLGDDGHTASIFPDQIELFNSGKYCVVAKHPKSNQMRVSITGSIINNAANILLLVTGKSKSRVITELLNDYPESVKYPAALINPNHGNYFWYLDEESASLI